MSLRIQNNVEALQANRVLTQNTDKLTKSMEKLSTGFRINRASDDAAGLGISEKMRGQVRGTAQAQRNIQDGISMVQTAEGSLDEVHSMLQRVRELAVQYSNGTQSTAGKSAINTEVVALQSEITRIGTSSKFNGINVLQGGSVTFQVGANDGEQINVALASIGGSVPTFCLASATAIASIDASIDSISDSRATLGATQNRLEHTMAVSATYQENLTAAESRIRDVDMAAEMTNMTKLQILQQAGTAMLAQANQAPQSVLSLIR